MGAFEDLHNGKIGFSEFERRTRKRWRRLARQVLRRWKAPPVIDEEDVRQEMLLAAFLVFGKYDSDRAKGGSVERYVVFNAYSEGKRHAHRHRKALRLSDKAPSRHDLVGYCSLEDAFDGEIHDLLSTSVEDQRRRWKQWLRIQNDVPTARDESPRVEADSEIENRLSWPEGLAVRVYVGSGDFAAAVKHLKLSPVMRRLGLKEKDCRALLRGAIERLQEAA